MRDWSRRARALTGLASVLVLSGCGAMPVSYGECEAAMRANAPLVQRVVVDPLPPGSLRKMVAVTTDPANCDSSFSDGNFGGVEALWDQTTGVDMVGLFETQGWERDSVYGGERRPSWFTERLTPRAGGAQSNDADFIGLAKEIEGRRFIVLLDRDGIYATVQGLG